MYAKNRGLKKNLNKEKNDLDFLKISLKQWVIQQRFKTLQ